MKYHLIGIALPKTTAMPNLIDVIDVKAAWGETAAVWANFCHLVFLLD